ncbi:MAG: hypothetical protein Fur0037_28180 [Planctomycetota bacterium]
MKQGGGQGRIKVPSLVEEGMDIPVEVPGKDVPEILVVRGGNSTDPPLRVKVDSDGKATIPSDPKWTAGTLLYVSTTNKPFVTVLVEIVPQRS